MNYYRQPHFTMRNILPFEPYRECMAASHTIGSVQTMVRIVEALSEFGEAGVTEIADDTGISKGTVHKHLTTLRSLDYIIKDGTNYRLGMRFLGLGNRIREQIPLYHVTRPVIDDLADMTNAMVNLMILEHGYGMYIYRAGPELNASSSLPAVGERVHLHATAGGKAILSQLENDEVVEIITERGIPKLTEKTIDSEQELRRELRSVRDRGLAFERGEHLPSVQCVAAPITTPDGSIGAISITGNIDRMSGKNLEEDLAGLIISTAKEIEISFLEK